MRVKTSYIEILGKSCNSCPLPLDWTKNRLSQVYLSIYKNIVLLQMISVLVLWPGLPGINQLVDGNYAASI